MFGIPVTLDEFECRVNKALLVSLRPSVQLLGLARRPRVRPRKASRSAVLKHEQDHKPCVTCPLFVEEAPNPSMRTELGLAPEQDRRLMASHACLKTSRNRDHDLNK